MTTMWIADHCNASLAEAGLATFDQVMSTTAGRCLRVLPDRENWYMPAIIGSRKHEESAQYSVLSSRITADRSRMLRGAFLKKHRSRTWQTWLAAVFGLAPPLSPGRIEAENAIALNSLGIEVMPLTAYGEQLRADGRLDSFMLSEELQGYCELQDFIARKFPQRESTAAESSRRLLHGLIAHVADIARRFHAAGYNHRDFYCCHFLIKEMSPGRFDVRLIDLQRVQRRRWFRRRWIVKDLAQLASMSPDDHVGCREKVLFLRTYLGVKKLRPRDKRLVRAVVRKLASIRRHINPKRKRGLNLPSLALRIGMAQLCRGGSNP